MQSSTFSLFVGDLSISCNEDDLYKLFFSYGTILDIRIKRNQSNTRSLQYGFVDFSNEKSAISAMHYLNGVLFKGRPITYDFSYIISIFYEAKCFISIIYL
jgi:RNA recognition motif-containing protein